MARDEHVGVIDEQGVEEAEVPDARGYLFDLLA
jgi:hypothetical protein